MIPRRRARVVRRGATDIRRVRAPKRLGGRVQLPVHVGQRVRTIAVRGNSSARSSGIRGSTRNRSLVRPPPRDAASGGYADREIGHRLQFTRGQRIVVGAPYAMAGPATPYRALMSTGAPTCSTYSKFCRMPASPAPVPAPP